jgi:hypothetical protein
VSGNTVRELGSMTGLPQYGGDLLPAIGVPIYHQYQERLHCLKV